MSIHFKMSSPLHASSISTYLFLTKENNCIKPIVLFKTIAFLISMSEPVYSRYFGWISRMCTGYIWVSYWENITCVIFVLWYVIIGKFNVRFTQLFQRRYNISFWTSNFVNYSASSFNTVLDNQTLHRFCFPQKPRMFI